MSGLNRLFVPDLGDQANLMPLHQSRQADMSAWCDGCHGRPGDGGTDGGKAGRREVCRVEEMGGEGAARLHLL